MNRSDLERVMTVYLEAMNSHDPAALARLYAPHCRIDSPLFGSLRGRAAVEESYRQWFQIFPDIEFKAQSTIVDPPTGAMLTHNIGTHQGDLMGLPPTHKKIEFRTMRVVGVEEANGVALIATERRIYDLTGVLVQLGVLRAKPAKP